MPKKVVMGSGLGLLLVASLLSLALSIFPKQDFLVGASVGGPIGIQAGLQYWERPCLGITRRVSVPDASFAYCIGVPHGRRHCFGYPELPDSGAAPNVKLPIGPLREMPCPAYMSDP